MSVSGRSRSGQKKAFGLIHPGIPKIGAGTASGHPGRQNSIRSPPVDMTKKSRYSNTSTRYAKYRLW